MHANEQQCLALVLKTEGGYVNNPRDPGGPTNKGITIATARRFFGRSFTVEQLKNLSTAQATAIYERLYSDPISFDNLPGGVDYTCLDYGVNSGPARPAKVLQTLVGVKADGKIGPITLAAVAKHDAKTLCDAINDERMTFLRGLSTWPDFGNGWSNRVAKVRAYSDILAVRANTIPADVALAPVATIGGNAKAIPAPASIPVKIGASAGAAGAAVAATAVETHNPWIIAATALATLYAAWKGLQANDTRIATTPAAGTVAIQPKAA